MNKEQIKRIADKVLFAELCIIAAGTSSLVWTLGYGMDYEAAVVVFCVLALALLPLTVTLAMMAHEDEEEIDEKSLFESPLEVKGKRVNELVGQLIYNDTLDDAYKERILYVILGILKAEPEKE